MRWSELVETPQIIGDDDFGLSDRKTNLGVAFGILKHDPVVVKEYPTAKLYHLFGDHGGQIALISHDNCVEYYVRYEVLNHPVLGRSATQIKLWRLAVARARGLASECFDGILLKNFDSVISDSLQTERGKEFWLTQLGNFHESHCIGALVGNDMMFYSADKSLLEWLARVDGWGKERKYKYIRFFISNKKMECEKKDGQDAAR